MIKLILIICVFFLSINTSFALDYYQMVFLDRKYLSSEDVHSKSEDHRRIYVDIGDILPKKLNEFIGKEFIVVKESGEVLTLKFEKVIFFNAPYKNCNTDYNNKGVDQINYIIDCLKDPKERYSRRLILSAWNPQQLHEMALPPCHVLAQFNVIDNKLSCSLYQRSGDVGLGVPFNIASYSLLTHIIAKHCDLEANEFIYHLGNCHIYDDHIEQLKKQLDNVLYPFPKIFILEKYDNINSYSIKDIKVEKYECNNVIKMEMRK